MAKRLRSVGWSRLGRSVARLAGHGMRAGQQAVGRALKAPAFGAAAVALKPPRPVVAPGAGDWLLGVAVGAGGARRFRLFRPPGLRFGERLPLLVMLHGCGQDAAGFAASTRMNRVAARERFMVLYPEQDRLANGQRCWNWFDTRSGRAHAEAALILQAIDQACLLHGADRGRVAIAGLSAGASMAALLVARHPERFRAVAMHSGIPPGTADSTLSALGAMRGRGSTAPLPASALAHWPPLLVIHGERDGVVAASNAQAAVEAWAEVAGARAAPPRLLQRGRRYPMTVTDFRHRGGLAATLVEVDQLGHAWSGGAAGQPFSDGRGPDASRLVWAFAKRNFPPP